MSDRRLRVLFLSSEVTPFSKTGGLSDISAALPRALSGWNCDVRIVTPRYGFIHHDHHGIVRLNGPLRRMSFRGQSLPFGFSRFQDGDGPTIHFIECDSLYDRPGIYVDPFTRGDYIDNDYRFIMLSRAAIEMCEHEDWTPDIIHCNDWQTALAAFYVERGRHRNQWPHARTLLTIHNIAYHGLFGTETLERISDEAPKFFYMGGPLEFYGHVNFLKAGLEFTDAVSTVSPTYAREIRSSYEYGYGLETVLRARGEDITGIINGIDTDIWNPETDPHIAATFTIDTLERKALNKSALCTQMGFAIGDDIPLIGSISRMAIQKGFEILLPVLHEILELPARLIFLGSGDPHYEHVLKEFARMFPDRIAVRTGFDENLSHLIEAGSDMFIMPSKYEPCGLNQMMSMRYGTLPIVRTTGGLADTVVDASDPDRGTGFCFTDYRSDALLDTVRRAVRVYHEKPAWKRLQHHAMSQDFTWSVSARKYRDLYDQCLLKPPRVLP